MIAEIGHYALILAFMVALYGASVPHFALARGDGRLALTAETGAVLQFFLVSTAFACLTWAFVTSDFSVKVVATNSHTAKPLLYRISGVWGNHEGSLLFWALNLTLFGSAVALFGRALPVRFRTRVLAVQSFIVLGFTLFMLATSNPFERLPVPPPEGNGLNPLLQDPGLAFHPPMLYLGYVGLSVAFSFAVAALIEGEVTPLWARWVRPWALTAWIFLTGGIALGSWWAYYELGWGGWWFWDPVENASFMPWLAAGALLHSAIVVEKRDALKSWTILLAILAFSLSLLGTFMVRSGVITSVHAFANDPERGLFILGFLAVVVGGSLTLYAVRARDLATGGIFGLISRESALVLNNVLLASFAGVVLIGTLYPLILEATSGDQISVGPPFFNFATTVLMAPLIIALGVGPLMSWKRGRLSRAAQVLWPGVVISLFAAIALGWRSAGDVVMSAFGLGLSAWLMVSALLEIGQRIQIGKGVSTALSRLRRVRASEWGMSLAHSGVAVLVLGVSLSETFTEEALTVVEPGDTVEVGAYTYRFDGVAPVIGPNYTAVEASFLVTRGKEEIAVLRPQDRVYMDPPMDTTEAAIHSLILGDLYAVIGEAAGKDRPGAWSVRLYFKPFVSALWLGALMMMLGGILSLSDRRLRVGVPTGKRHKPADDAALGQPAE